MGYYIEVPQNFNKAQQIKELYEGEIVDYTKAKETLTDKTKAVICCVRNPLFEAAAFCFDQKEFDDFHTDERFKQYVVIDRQKAKELTGYPSHKE